MSSGYVGKYETKTKGTLWRIVVQWTDAAGEPHRHDERGFPSKREAEKRKRVLLSSVEESTYVQRSTATVEGFLTQTWLPHVKRRVRPNTYRGYEVEVRRHICPNIGHRALQSLAPFDVEQMYETLEEELAPKTVNNVGATLGTALEYAISMKMLVQNVARMVDRPPFDKPEPKAWSAEELRTFLARVEGDRLASLWTLLATTGLRRGEGLGLRWEDVDLGGGQLAVRQNLTTVNGTISIGPPKTRSSVRTMMLDAETLAALARHRTLQKRERLECGPGWQETGLVFTREDGTALRPDYISRTFTKLCVELGLKKIGVHGLRHTYATLSLKAGVPLKVVSVRLGHSSVAITADTYSHVSPAWDQEAANMTAAAIFGPPTLRPVEDDDTDDDGAVLASV